MPTPLLVLRAVRTLAAIAGAALCAVLDHVTPLPTDGDWTPVRDPLATRDSAARWPGLQRPAGPLTRTA